MILILVSALRLLRDAGGVLMEATPAKVDLEALRQNGYAATDLSPSRREPFILKEEDGVRLGLLFLALCGALIMLFRG